MVTIEARLRKGKVLTPSAIPCLRNLPTVNITLGCSHGCGYCYIQGYANYPGDDRIVLFVNTAELIRDELRRMRHKPRRVYFSPSSDAFQYQPEVQKVTLNSMRELLDAGVEVAFLTKGFLTPDCYRLFSKHPGKVFAQIGITTLNPQLSRRFEPRAAPPAMRLDTIRRLVSAGIPARPRLDPLIPDVTDTAENLDELLGTLGMQGIRQVSASFLFVRSAFVGTVKTQYAQLGVGFGPSRWTSQPFDNACGSAKSLSHTDRQSRFDQIAGIATRHDIEISICTCKNPDIAGQGCIIAAAPRNEPAPSTLFNAIPERVQFPLPIPK